MYIYICDTSLCAQLFCSRNTPIYAIFQSCSFSTRILCVCFSWVRFDVSAFVYEIQRILYVIVATSCSTCCSHIYFYCFLPLSCECLSCVSILHILRSNRIHICATYVQCVHHIRRNIFNFFLSLVCCCRFEYVMKN